MLSDSTSLNDMYQNLRPSGWVDLLGGFGDLLVLGYQVEFSLMTWKDWQRGLNTLRANNVTLATWRISNGWLSSVARFVGDEMRSPVRWGCVE